MRPPYTRISKAVGRQRPTASVVWDTFDANGKFLLTLSRDALEKLVNHPQRTWDITVQTHQDPEGKELFVLTPSTTLEITWGQPQ